MVDVSKYTGAVNVNSDITPITRQKIEKVTPDKWMEMDISALFDQRMILNERMIKAYQSGHAEIGKQIQSGLNSIDALLRVKDAELTAKNQEDMFI